MEIRRAQAGEREYLLEVWLRSAKATHTFVSTEDLACMIPQVKEYFASGRTEIWVACTDSGELMGFMGMSHNKMESLFLAPEFQRRGIGTQLVRFAQSLHSELFVDVNEQNSSAVAFYQTCGFAFRGRSEFDDQGRLYPLLHMYWERQKWECR
jgi:putative acetyltransferase